MLAGNPAAATLQYRRALEMNPHFHSAHGNLGAALAAAGHWPEALASFLRSVEYGIASPDAVSTEINLATCIRNYQAYLFKLHRSSPHDPATNTAHIQFGAQIEAAQRLDVRRSGRSAMSSNRRWRLIGFRQPTLRVG